MGEVTDEQLHLLSYKRIEEELKSRGYYIVGYSEICRLKEHKGISTERDALREQLKYKKNNCFNQKHQHLEKELQRLRTHLGLVEDSLDNEIRLRKVNESHTRELLHRIKIVRTFFKKNSLLASVVVTEIEKVMEELDPHGLIFSGVIK